MRVALPVMLALVGCSAPPAPDNASDVAPSGNVAIITPSQTPVPTPTPTPSQTGTTAKTFPIAFRGRWGLTPNDCDAARADNKGLMVIAADDIRFYESRARIARLSVSSPARIMAELAFSGEGQTWQSRTAFDLSDDGATLTRAEESTSFRYARCAA